MKSTERLLRGELDRDDPAWDRWLKYEILSNQVRIMDAIESLQKAIARITSAAENLHSKHAGCPTNEDVQEAADALHRLADKLEGGATKAAEAPAVPA